MSETYKILAVFIKPQCDSSRVLGKHLSQKFASCCKCNLGEIFQKNFLKSLNSGKQETNEESLTKNRIKYYHNFGVKTLKLIKYLVLDLIQVILVFNSSTISIFITKFPLDTIT